MKHLIAKCLVLLIVCLFAEASEPQVFLNGTTITGTTLTSAAYGKQIHCFLGIPYAEPPIGSLRFREPLPYVNLPFNFQATEDGNSCMQLNGTTVIGSEDCLYLNVYKPSDATVNSRLPVMVFIHGGGFSTGSCSSLLYSPEVLLDHDIVFCCLNYRLGALGFLSTGQEDCPGNNGIKDQILALKWIKYNILAFGGDPNRITIFGQSAGAGSINYLMEMQQTTDLFHGAITLSGSNVASYPHTNGVQNGTEQLAALMLCPYVPFLGLGWSQTIECMRNCSAEQMTLIAGTALDLPVLFLPTFELGFIEDTRDKHSEKALSTPLMTGVTCDEGGILAAALMNNSAVFKGYMTLINYELPNWVLYYHYSQNIKDFITTTLKSEFFNIQLLLTHINFKNLTRLFSGSFFWAGFDLYLRTRFSGQHAPTYCYLYCFFGSISYIELVKADPKKFKGVVHCDDLWALFPLEKSLFFGRTPTEKDKEMRNISTTLFVNFARYTDPTPIHQELHFPQWLPSDSFPLRYYDRGNDSNGNPLCGMKDGSFFEKHLQFWRKHLSDVEKMLEAEAETN